MMITTTTTRKRTLPVAVRCFSSSSSSLSSSSNVPPKPPQSPGHAGDAGDRGVAQERQEFVNRQQQQFGAANVPPYTASSSGQPPPPQSQSQRPSRTNQMTNPRNPQQQQQQQQQQPPHSQSQQHPPPFQRPPFPRRGGDGWGPPPPGSGGGGGGGWGPGGGPPRGGGFPPPGGGGAGGGGGGGRGGGSVYGMSPYGQAPSQPPQQPPAPPRILPTPIPKRHSRKGLPHMSFDSLAKLHEHTQELLDDVKVNPVGHWFSYTPQHQERQAFPVILDQDRDLAWHTADAAVQEVEYLLRSFARHIPGTLTWKQEQRYLLGLEEEDEERQRELVTGIPSPTTLRKKRKLKRNKKKPLEFMPLEIDDEDDKDEEEDQDDYEEEDDNASPPEPGSTYEEMIWNLGLQGGVLPVPFHLSNDECLQILQAMQALIQRLQQEGKAYMEVRAHRLRELHQRHAFLKHQQQKAKDRDNNNNNSEDEDEDAQLQRLLEGGGGDGSDAAPPTTGPEAFPTKTVRAHFVPMANQESAWGGHYGTGGAPTRKNWALTNPDNHHPGYDANGNKIIINDNYPLESSRFYDLVVPPQEPKWIFPPGWGGYAGDPPPVWTEHEQLEPVEDEKKAHTTAITAATTRLLQDLSGGSSSGGMGALAAGDPKQQLQINRSSNNNNNNKSYHAQVNDILMGELKGVGIGGSAAADNNNNKAAAAAAEAPKEASDEDSADAYFWQSEFNAAVAGEEKAERAFEEEKRNWDTDAKLYHGYLYQFACPGPTVDMYTILLDAMAVCAQQAQPPKSMPPRKSDHDPNAVLFNYLTPFRIYDAALEVQMRHQLDGAHLVNQNYCTVPNKVCFVAPLRAVANLPFDDSLTVDQNKENKKRPHAVSIMKERRDEALSIGIGCWSELQSCPYLTLSSAAYAYIIRLFRRYLPSGTPIRGTTTYTMFMYAEKDGLIDPFVVHELLDAQKPSNWMEVDHFIQDQPPLVQAKKAKSKLEKLHLPYEWKRVAYVQRHHPKDDEY
ncbi:hypothetical protein ACA910_017834 [Epithemia clementina (nom. ined.)]